MNILIVSSFLPFPLFSGGHVRLYNIIKKLAENHSIFLVCERRDYQTSKDIQELEKFCKKVLVVNRKKQWSFSTILRTLFSSDPFLVVGHTNREMKNKIQSILDTELIDIIHAETFYIMQNIPATKIPIVLIEHNIEYLVYKRYVQKAPLLLRPLLNIDITKLQKKEEYFWRNATKLVAVSEEEKKLMNRDAFVVPNGVDTEKFKVKSLKVSNEKRILFIGDFKWIQNKIAIEWLLKEIWPAFTKTVNDSRVKLWVVSRKIPKNIRFMNLSDSIIYDENAPADTDKIFEKSDILISPVQVGGGTSFKVLEAMASGVPVITTSLGIEGIKAEDKKEYILAENSNDFVNGLSTLLENENLYNEISLNARDRIKKMYSWDIIVKELEKVYKSALTT